LREDFANAVIAGVLLTVGLTCFALSAYRTGREARPLIYLGSFGVLYSLRLLADADTLGGLVGIPETPAAYLVAFITYGMPLPGLLLVQEWIGPGWKSSLRWMLWFQAAYAVTAIAVDSVAAPGAALRLNNSIVLLGLGLMAFNIGLFFAKEREEARALLRSRRLRPFLAGLVFLSALVMNENLVEARLVPWSWSHEPLGVLVFVVTLGMVAADRFVAHERQVVSFSQEMETARRIQSSILPRQMPRVEGIAIAARYLPMASVGGDFYDFLAMDRTRIGVLVADVSGHGVPAALIASMVKIALASQAGHAAEPAELLTGMNRILLGKLERAFVTAAYLFVDLEQGRVLYASAGHPPLLVGSRGAGGAREERQEALPLGRFRHAAYRTSELTLGTGDRLLLYTDGVIEAASPAGEAFGDERLLHLLAESGGLDADGFAGALLGRLATWSGRQPGEPLDDDVTVLVIDAWKS
jgi:serine phosphatase RsbU (regulator of sigma subunit)